MCKSLFTYSVSYVVLGLFSSLFYFFHESRRTSKLFDELEALFGSVTAIPVEVLLTGYPCYATLIFSLLYVFNFWELSWETFLLK